jgi:hypothetical protein
VIFHIKVANVQNIHHHQQCIVDNDMQHTGRRSVLLLMEQQNKQFQFHASGLAVYVVLRCKQQSLEHSTGKSLIMLNLVILVDAPFSPFSNST